MSRGVSAKVVPISRGRRAVRCLSPQRISAPLRARGTQPARGVPRETPMRVTPAWVCIVSLVAVTMWPSAAVLLVKLALRMFWG